MSVVMGNCGPFTVPGIRATGYKVVILQYLWTMSVVMGNCGPFTVPGLRSTGYKVVILQYLWTMSVVMGNCGPFTVPGLRSTGYKMIQKGDIDLAGFFPIGTYSSVKPCGDSVNLRLLVTAEAMVYAIDKVNQRSDLLPNISLGYVILDDCKKESTALGRALHLIPAFKEKNHPCVDEGYFPFYDVVGIVGGMTSSLSVAIAQFSSVFQIPQISPISTSDVLSNKEEYPYFMRVMPPDKHQTEAIIQLISHFNWTYISTFHREGAYGTNAVTQIKKQARERGICVAVSAEVTSLTTPSEYDLIAKTLRRNGARVVVVFAPLKMVKQLFSSLDSMGVHGELIWIFGDVYSVKSPPNIQFEKVLKNAFFIEIHYKHDPPFERHISSISPMVRKNNEWLRKYWRDYYNCEWTYTGNANASPCINYTHVEGLVTNHMQPFVIDSIYTFAHGLHTYLNAFCHNEMLVKGRLLKECISGPKLYQYLKRVSFKGVHDSVRFDSNGDGFGTYDIIHFTGRTNQGKAGYYKLASWSSGDTSIKVNQNTIQWTQKMLNGELKQSLNVPESVCSHPCQPGQFIIPKEPECCWECRKCRSNEITSKNATTCTECPDFTWPDQKTFQECVSIEPYVISWRDALSVLLTLFSIVGIIATATIVAIFYSNRHNRLIKASGRELNGILFAGAFCAYLTVFVLIAKPNQYTCQAGRAGFNIVFAAEYTALFAKTSRIFRIFNSGKRGVKRAAFISTKSQLVLCGVLIGIQVCAFFPTHYLLYYIVVCCMDFNIFHYINMTSLWGFHQE